MTEKSIEQTFDEAGKVFGVGITFLGACIAIVYLFFGSFADPDCGRAAILSGKIASVSGSSGSWVTLKLEGEPTKVRHMPFAKGEVELLTTALKSNKGNLATITYRTGGECKGGLVGAGKRVFPISIEVGGSLLLSEDEVRASVKRERRWWFFFIVFLMFQCVILLLPKRQQPLA